MSIDELAAKYANMSDVLMDVDEETEGKFLNRSFKKIFYKYMCYILFLYKFPDKQLFLTIRYYESFYFTKNYFVLQKHL